MSSGESPPAIVIAPWPGLETAAGPTYALAGGTIQSARTIPELEPFRVGSGRAPGWSLPSLDEVVAEVYRGRGWVGGRLLDVACHRHETCYLLESEGLGAFVVSADGGRIVGPRGGDSASRGARAAIVGPCLCLALALRSSFCLHAAAVLAEDGAVLVLGESGSGKSTLAAAAAGAGLPRIADDTLPVALTPSGALALPRFPQLKLRAAAQWPLEAPARVPIRAVYLLSREAAARAPRSRPVSSHDATVALLRHTVAARLFDRELRARHLDFAARLAARCEVRTLAVPDALDELPAAVELLARGGT